MGRCCRLKRCLGIKQLSLALRVHLFTLGFPRRSGFPLLLLLFISSCALPGAPDEIAGVTALPLSPTASPTVPSTALATASPTTHPTATLGLPDTSEALARVVFGVELNQLTTSKLDWAGRLGAEWVRYNGVLWSVVEPSKGERRWDNLSSLEQALAEAASKGIEIILVVRGTAAWAQAIPGWHCGPILPEKLVSFAAFMGDLVARYGGPPYHVKYWELWNEPDVAPAWVPAASPFGCWGDLADPYFGGAYYAEMLGAVYPATRAADPEAMVLVGGLMLDCDPRNPPPEKDCQPAQYLEGILSAGGGDFFDGVAFHSYDYYGGELGQYSNPNWHSDWNTTGPVLIAKVRFLRDLLARYGYPDKSLLNTETALLCGRNGTEPPCTGEDYGDTKASYVAQAYAAAATEGLVANIWYSLTGWRGSGLLDATLQPGLAFDAFQFASQMLSGAVPEGQIAGLPGMLGYSFSRSEDRFWILWSMDGAQHALALPGVPEAVFDIYREQHEPRAEGGIGRGPMYIVWQQ